MQWQVEALPEVLEWLEVLDASSQDSVYDAMEALSIHGQALGRPMVDKIKGSNVHNLKELRSASSGRTEIRILFVFDPRRHAVLLVAGDKTGQWNKWYQRNIPLAERRYEEHLRRIQEARR